MRMIAAGITVVVAALGIAAAGFARDHEWKGTLTPGPGSNVSGKAEVESEAAMVTDAEVDIQGGTAGESHPWHVHKGSCGNDGGILGDATAYPPLVVKSNGKAESEAKLSIATPTEGQYFVNVHKSAEDLKTIVACGNLVMSGEVKAKEKTQATPKPSGY